MRLSAYVPWYFRAYFPGFEGLSKTPTGVLASLPSHRLADEPGGSFPGGCDGTMRLLVKWLNPSGDRGDDGVRRRPQRPHPVRGDGPAGRAVPHARRLRQLSASCTTQRRTGEPAVITYIKDGKLYSVRARTGHLGRR